MAKNIKKQNDIGQDDEMSALCLEFLVKGTITALALSASAAFVAPYVPEHLKEKIKQIANTDLDAHRQNVAEQVDKAPENLRKLMNALSGQGQDSKERQRQPRKPAPDKCTPEKSEIGGFVFTLPC